MCVDVDEAELQLIFEKENCVSLPVSGFRFGLGQGRAEGMPPTPDPTYPHLSLSTAWS